LDNVVFGRIFVEIKLLISASVAQPRLMDVFVKV